MATKGHENPQKEDAAPVLLFVHFCVFRGYEFPPLPANLREGKAFFPGCARR
jgi:hypothetical protein